MDCILDSQNMPVFSGTPGEIRLYLEEYPSPRDRRIYISATEEIVSASEYLAR